MVYQRYADDFVVGFEFGYEAQRFFSELPKRLNKFCLEIAPEKSGIVRFSRCDLRGSGRFVYLGFDFYWARTRSGKQTVKRRTNTKKFQQALKSLKVWINGAKSTPLKRLASTLRSKLAGHFNYYGVIGNSHRLSEFFNAARHTIYRALNSRSQKKSYNWAGFTAMWKTLDIPNPKIVETMQPSTPCFI